MKLFTLKALALLVTLIGINTNLALAEDLKQAGLIRNVINEKIQQNADTSIAVKSEDAKIEENEEITKKDEAKPNRIHIDDKEASVQLSFNNSDSPAEILVPISFFLFLLILFLGRGYFNNKTQQRKIELLEKMVEKGQPVSDTVIQQIFADSGPRKFGADWEGKSLRRGVALTLAGAGLLIFSFVTHKTGPSVVAGIILLSLGVGSLVSHKYGKDNSNLPDAK